MKNSGWTKFIKTFGFIYFAVNCLVFAVLCVMMIHSWMKFSQFFGGGVLLIFPLLGILAGNWMRHQKFNGWRISVICVSLLSATGFLFFVFFIAPVLKDIKQQKMEKISPQVALPVEVKDFFTAVYADDVKGVKQKLNKGMDVNVVNNMEQTALHITQNEEMVNLLIANGADVDARDDMGMTPMFNKEIPLVKILVEAGADIHATSEKGNSVVMWYAYSDYGEGVKYFIGQGVDVNHKNEDGQTVYDIAEKFGHFESLAYLRSVGARPGKELK